MPIPEVALETFPVEEVLEGFCKQNADSRGCRFGVGFLLPEWG